MARVLIFTDQPVLAEAFKRVLATTELELAGVCSDPAELATQFHATLPDVAILHVAPLPSLETVHDVRRVYPHCSVVLWAEKLFMETALQAMEFGVRGILSSSLAPELLANALCKIAEGELQFHFPAMMSGPMGFQRVSLSGRERELLSLICQGLKNKEIATVMRTTEGTIKTYLNRLFKRLGVKDRFELALYGLEEQKRAAVSMTGLGTFSGQGGEVPNLTLESMWRTREGS